MKRLTDVTTSWTGVRSSCVSALAPAARCIAGWAVIAGLLSTLAGCPFFNSDSDEQTGGADPGPPCSAVSGPLDLTMPQDVTVFDGQTAEFHATASNAEAYRWLEGGVVLQDAVFSSFWFGPVTMADNGKRFQFVAYNCRGSVGSHVGGLLTVLPLAPSVSQPPQDLTVQEGQSATFEVVAAGSAPFTYQWRRDGAEIAGATGASYTVSNVVLGDSGARFDVVISNAAAKLQSGFATLTVEERTSPASLDRSFANAGVAVTTLAGHDLFPHTLVNLPDGRHALVGRGQAFGQTEATKLVVAVYRPDGTPDTSVGADGLIVRDVAAWFADRAPSEQFQRVELAWAPARSATYHERNGVAGIVVGLQATTMDNFLGRHYSVLARFWLAGAAAGDLDPGFGDAGIVRRLSPTSPGSRSTRGLAVDGSQRIYELWTTGFTTSAQQGSASSLLRWRPDGSPDPDWGSGGEVVLNDPMNAPGQRVEVLAGGKVLVVGIERDGALRYPIVARFDTDGSADANYGVDGSARVARAALLSTLNAGIALWDLSIDSSGRSLVGVSGAGGFYVARLSADGTLDVSFTDQATHPWEAGFFQEVADCGLRAMPDGRLLIVGSFSTGFIVRRWLADLSAEDPSFNRDADGHAWTAHVFPFENVTGAMFRCISSHVQPDGRIVIAGHAYGIVPGLLNGFGLVRLRGGEY